MDFSFQSILINAVPPLIIGAAFVYVLRFIGNKQKEFSQKSNVRNDKIVSQNDEILEALREIKKLLENRKS